jgi:predicted phosphodiesterase
VDQRRRDRWRAAQLTAADLAYLRAFQPTITAPLDEARTLLCYHGSPRSHDEWITAETPDATLREMLREMLAQTRAAFYVGGHSHQQTPRRYRDALALNPGAVGFAKDAIPPGAPIGNPAWAE